LEEFADISNRFDDTSQLAEMSQFMAGKTEGMNRNEWVGFCVNKKKALVEPQKY